MESVKESCLESIKLAVSFAGGRRGRLFKLVIDAMSGALEPSPFYKDFRAIFSQNEEIFVPWSGVIFRSIDRSPRGSTYLGEIEGSLESELLPNIWIRRNKKTDPASGRFTRGRKKRYTGNKE